MTNLKTKLVGGLAAASLFAASAVPAFATTNVAIVGNGAFSTNKVKVTNTKTTTLTQTNKAVFINSVSTSSTTGSNSSSFNTGGGTFVVTGDAASSVTVTNVANSNVIN